MRDEARCPSCSDGDCEECPLPDLAVNRRSAVRGGGAWTDEERAAFRARVMAEQGATAAEIAAHVKGEDVV